uniref:Putative secreted protein n=1 Tax=Anopheles darlingi TaxID=43151 RepID=A0A2M4DKL4_ANODA
MALAIRLNFLCRYLRLDGGQLLAITLLIVEATLASSTTFELLLLATFAADVSGTIFALSDFLSLMNKASPDSSRLRGLAEY